MARFYFDIMDGLEHVDEVGTELADLAAVRIEAVRLSAEVLKEMPERFWHSEQWTMTVRDADRSELFMLKFCAESV